MTTFIYCEHVNVRTLTVAFLYEAPSNALTYSVNNDGSFLAIPNVHVRLLRSQRRPHRDVQQLLSAVALLLAFSPSQWPTFHCFSIRRPTIRVTVIGYRCSGYGGVRA